MFWRAKKTVVTYVNGRLLFICSVHFITFIVFHFHFSLLPKLGSNMCSKPNSKILFETNKKAINVLGCC
jgi:hypothetical protein